MLFLFIIRIDFKNTSDDKQNMKIMYSTIYCT